ncbi:peptide deformylase [Nonlabens ponticola]|uniref:Peptide deformylase n=1 Tax=Nonlabens ponticola TaxID=2496866 RepID=A0A3S9MXA2_9FLAO|nr:peptide deformylase [Nonlabens ponticola]AZQ43759.1 peptide deformylase [Nonlabens ponticola]
MILPIVAYGDPVLRKETVEIDADYPKLQDFIANMWETMENASGVGLAAPQVGVAVRVFVVDTAPFSDDPNLSSEEQKELAAFRKVFVNAQIEDESGDEWIFNEGCLSIPNVREDVSRQENVTITYYDEEFKKHTETYDGLIARVIQHEYDHIEGILFTDKISSLKKRLIKNKLNNISKGKTSVDYRMRFPDVKGRR